jgi:hypothetical protein
MFTMIASPLPGCAPLANTRRFTALTGVKVRIDSENWEELRAKAALDAEAGDGSFQSSFARDYQKPEAAGNTKSVIVSLLIMDDVADHLAREQDKLPVILNQFSGSPEPSRTYAEFWQERKDVGVVP